MKRGDLPNLLTFLRIVSVILFLILIEMAGGDPRSPLQRGAVFLFIASALTDWMDGYLARHFHAVSNLGKLLDPLADKLIVFSALILATHHQWIEGWVVVLLLFRELFVIFLRLNAMERGQVLAPDWGGKSKTILQLVGIPFLLWQTPLFSLIPTAETGRILLYISLVISFISGIRYFLLYFRSQ
jgi:CDP-diacylglycerol--glycerol-3-phosphate 3-phosphatidyltransferase